MRGRRRHASSPTPRPSRQRRRSQLRWCRAVPPSQIAFTYVDQASPRRSGGVRRHGQAVRTLAASGERWTFGLDPSRVAGYLRETAGIAWTRILARPSTGRATSDRPRQPCVGTSSIEIASAHVARTARRRTADVARLNGRLLMTASTPAGPPGPRSCGRSPRATWRRRPRSTSPTASSRRIPIGRCGDGRPSGPCWPDSCAQKPRWLLHDAEVVQAGDVALVRSQWTVTITDAAGASTRLDLRPTLVARRQPDGRWLVVIDRPA